MKFETATLLAASLVVVAALSLGALLFVPVPAANRDAVNLVLGALIGWVGAVVTFYFGSSKASQAKDDTIANLSAPTDPKA